MLVAERTGMNALPGGHRVQGIDSGFGLLGIFTAVQRVEACMYVHIWTEHVLYMYSTAP